MAIERKMVSEFVQIKCDKCGAVLARYASERGENDAPANLDKLQLATILCQDCAAQSGHLKIRIGGAWGINGAN